MSSKKKTKLIDNDKPIEKTIFQIVDDAQSQQDQNEKLKKKVSAELPINPPTPVEEPIAPAKLRRHSKPNYYKYDILKE